MHKLDNFFRNEIDGVMVRYGLLAAEVSNEFVAILFFDSLKIGSDDASTSHPSFSTDQERHRHPESECTRVDLCLCSRYLAALLILFYSPRHSQQRARRLQQAAKDEQPEVSQARALSSPRRSSKTFTDYDVFLVPLSCLSDSQEVQAWRLSGEIFGSYVLFQPCAIPTFLHTSKTTFTLNE